MRAYEPYTLFKPTYPVDFVKIKHYLFCRGKINITDIALEDKYVDFSDTKGSSWLAPTDSTLEEFARYLYEIEIDDSPSEEVVITDPTSDPEPTESEDPTENNTSDPIPSSGDEDESMNTICDGVNDAG